MLWVTLSRDDVLSTIQERELAELERGLDDVEGVLADVIADVVGLVRGYIGACEKNQLGPTGTLPPSCVSHACAMVVFRLHSRAGFKAVPKPRQLANEEADSFLQRVAKCMFRIEVPDTPADDGEQPSNRSTIAVHSSTPDRIATRDTLKGL